MNREGTEAAVLARVPEIRAERNPAKRDLLVDSIATDLGIDPGLVRRAVRMIGTVSPKQPSAGLWAADPHRFGPGKVHAIDEEKSTQTYCGKVMAEYPGRSISSGSVTCKICCDAPAKRAEGRARSEEYRRQWEEQERERDRVRADEEREWRTRYNAHMKSDKWANIRIRIFERSNWLCEGCGVAAADEVHHLTYAHMGDEFLWELRAVCCDCHERFHASEDKG